MADSSPLKTRFSTKVNETRFVFPILFAILVSMLLVQLVLLVEPYGEETLFGLQGSFRTSSIVNMFVATVVFGLILFVLFRVRKIRNETAAKVLIAIFIEGGMLSILLFGKLVFTLLKLESPIFLVFVAIVAYIGTYFAFLAFFDALSQKGKNRLFVVSSGSLGAFIGVLMPIVSIIAISIILAIVDLFLIQSRLFQRIVGDSDYEKMILEMAFPTRDWGIGIGDLICYSMVVSSTFGNYGIAAGGLSLFLIIIGALFTAKIASKNKRVPGLPIAIGLGLLPSIVFLLFSAF